MKKLAILGSTGSIGVSTLDIVGRFPDRFRRSVPTGIPGSGALRSDGVNLHTDDPVCLLESEERLVLFGALTRERRQEFNRAQGTSAGDRGRLRSGTQQAKHGNDRPCSEPTSRSVAFVPEMLIH